MQVKTQQKETKNFFNKTANDWKKKSNSLKIKVPVIQQRNSYVLSHIIQRKDKVFNFLDIGCGTGELAYQVSKKKINSIGIDFSDKMIELCNKYSNANLKFECADALNYSSKIKFDVISANGFFEYISLRELNNFLKKIGKNLNKNGYLIFSVRNRLFNLFSLNEFTKNEINSNSGNPDGISDSEIHSFSRIYPGCPLWYQTNWSSVLDTAIAEGDLLHLKCTIFTIGLGILILPLTIILPDIIIIADWIS